MCVGCLGAFIWVPNYNTTYNHRCIIYYTLLSSWDLYIPEMGVLGVWLTVNGCDKGVNGCDKGVNGCDKGVNGCVVGMVFRRDKVWLLILPLFILLHCLCCVWYKV